jgi:hypothetical protein
MKLTSQIPFRPVYVILLIFTLISCNKYPDPVLEALSQMNKENRSKFEKVIAHYSSPGDSLKLKACYFLIENMTGKGYYDGKQLRDYNVIFDILADKPADYRENLPWYSGELVVLFDSLNSVYGRLDKRNLHFVKDEDAFTAGSFIQYIEEAFRAWNEPWSRKHVSFHDFCHYVLPYRNFNEPLEPWRTMFREKFKWIHDSVSGEEDLIEIARLLNRDSELKYSNGFGNYIVPISPGNLLKARYGACADNSNYKAMIMRAFGIPVAIDFLPRYGNDHNSHYWNSVMDRNGNFVSFEEALNDINAFVAYKYRIAKVYRKTFSKNSEFEKITEELKGGVPPFLQDPYFIDVTKQYVAVTDVKLVLNNIPEGTEYVYVAVFDDAAWDPIACAGIVNGEYAVFRDLGREIMYLPVYFTEGKVIPASLPFRISKKGYIRYIEPGKKETRVILLRKYHMHRRKINWLKCLENGRFEGAGKADFSDAVTLARIEKTPGEHAEELIPASGKSFRFLRFVFSPEESELTYDGDGASIAETEFYNHDGQKIEGTPFGSPGRKYNPYEPGLCFDGDPLTFFEDARYGEAEKYAGIALNRLQQVGRIRFVPRNDLNSIQPDNEYELFYWDNHRFVSLGKKVAADTMVVYDHVPEGAILWLRNLTAGKEERIFTWENGRQVWW